MVELVGYIARELGDPQAAGRLAEDLIEAGERIPDFPYASPVYRPIRPLEQEYRRLLVRNYAMFYRVDEAVKLATVVRVVYARRDCGALLE